MILGGLLAKAAVGSEIAKNGIVGTVKGVGDILSGIREGLITVYKDFKYGLDREEKQANPKQGKRVGANNKEGGNNEGGH